MSLFMRPLTCRAIIGCCLILALLPVAALAGEEEEKRFRGGIEIGAGSLRLEGPGGSRSESTTCMAFTVGYLASAQLSIGIELGGHTLEAGNLWDPSQGAGVSQVFLVMQYYLQPVRRGWYARGGTGFVNYWDNSPDGLEDEGWGMSLALGYDFQTENFGKVGPLISYGYGEAGLLEHRALALALIWSFP